MAYAATSRSPPCAVKLHVAVDDCFAPLARLGRILISSAGELVSQSLSLLLAHPGYGSGHLGEEDLWYGAGDFERFKQDVIKEARSAGCEHPEEQYEHIRRKFQDETTLKNTAMNVVRTKSSCNLVEEEAKALALAAAVASEEPAQQLATGGVRRGSLAKPTGAGKRGHRRNVSFDFEKEAAASGLALGAMHLLRPTQPQTLVAAAASAAAMKEGIPTDGSLSDELLSIIQGKDDPEAATIFL